MTCVVRLSGILSSPVRNQRTVVALFDVFWKSGGLLAFPNGTDTTTIVRDFVSTDVSAPTREIQSDMSAASICATNVAERSSNSGPSSRMIRHNIPRRMVTIATVMYPTLPSMTCFSFQVFSLRRQRLAKTAIVSES
ncbi:MAG: hypothetical protein WC773_04025 [Patescibacteria group bacterium]